MYGGVPGKIRGQWGRIVIYFDMHSIKDTVSWPTEE
jgi:hypothetical protein